MPDTIIHSLAAGVPANSLVGNLTPGVGPARPVSIADVAQAVVALGVVATPGAPSSLAPIADQRFLANISGVTAVPTATPFTSITTVGTVTTGTWNAGTVGSNTNSSGSRPASTTPAGWQITGNYASASEVDLWNTVNAGTGFNFYQKTGAAAESKIGYFTTDRSTFSETSAQLGSALTYLGITSAAEGYFGTTESTFDIYSNTVINLWPGGVTNTVSFPNTGGVQINGATSGSITVKTPAVAGTRTLTLPAGTTDFSATGGSSQVVKQTSAGGAFTVGQLGFSDISGTAAVNQGGTGQTSYTDGQLLIGNSSGNTLTKANLTAGSNVTITNGGGSITIAASTGGGGGVGGLWSGVMSTLPTSTNTGLTTWLNQGGASVADSGAGVTLTLPSNSSAQNVRGRYKAAPSTPYTITALLSMTPLSYGQFTAIGLGWHDGTKIQGIEINQRTTSPSPLVFVLHYATTTSSPTVDFSPTVSTMPYTIWFQINDDGTNFAFRYSFDGANFKTLFSGTKSGGFLGSSGYSNILFYGNAFNTDTFGSLMSYTQA